MKKILLIPLFLLLLSSGWSRTTGWSRITGFLGLQAQETDSTTPLEKEKRFNRIYDQTSDILLKSGYQRWFLGLKMGEQKGDFELPRNQSIHVAPLSNRTGDDSEEIAALLKRLGQRTALLLENTKLFSNVSYGEGKQESDYRLEIYVRGILGKNCLWGLDLYDGKTGQKLLSGFDKESSLVRDFAYGIFLPSSESPTTQDYFIDTLPKKAALFVSRTNPAFNQEYFSKLQKVKGPRSY